MPVFGLGTGGPDDDPEAIAKAVRAGYRLVDTAELYENEEIVGEGIRRSGVHRDSLFLSSKHGHWCDGEPPPAVAAAVPAEHRGVRGGGAGRRGGAGFRAFVVAGALLLLRLDLGRGHVAHRLVLVADLRGTKGKVLEVRFLPHGWRPIAGLCG